MATTSEQSTARVYRGRVLHIALGGPTGPNDQPIMQEREALCGIKMTQRWLPLRARRYTEHPYCAICVAAGGQVPA